MQKLTSIDDIVDLNFSNSLGSEATSVSVTNSDFSFTDVLNRKIKKKFEIIKLRNKL